MKNVTLFLFCAALFLPAIVFPSCAGGAPAREGGASVQEGASAQGGGAVFSDVEGKEWVLLELKSAGQTVAMDRQKLEADSMGGVYTISFQEGRVSGMGAPNRYFGPYTLDNSRTLSIGNLASTMMMAFREPDGLKENEYFAYLSKVTRWDLREGKLELYSSDGSGAEAVLVFVRK